MFDTLYSLEDVARLLDSTAKQLRYLLYVRKPEKRYYTFCIVKRGGGLRSISAPSRDLKAIQRRLASILQDIYEVRTPVHGFVRERSIVSNAESHVRHRSILNIDLQDFFPSINFGRVRGLFIARPCSASPHIATILAQLCCHEGALPQGAPTSPILSNMVCYRMDARLAALAKQHRCVYTRYADDLSVSKRRGAFPGELAILDATGVVRLGDDLRTAIQQNGFTIHPDKVRLHLNTSRQSVTGLTVNTRVNVKRKFLRNLRAVLHDARKNGLESAEATHHSLHYRRQRRASYMPPLDCIIRGKLDFLKMVRGENDPLRRKLQGAFVEVWPTYLATIEREMAKLNMRDFFICHASEDKETLVLPLVGELIKLNMSVWIDKYEIRLGEDIFHRITEGLKVSRQGIVVLSRNSLRDDKRWIKQEISALFGQETPGEPPRLVPIWHEVGLEEVKKANPILATRLALVTKDRTFKDMALELRASHQPVATGKRI